MARSSTKKKQLKQARARGQSSSAKDARAPRKGKDGANPSSPSSKNPATSVRESRPAVQEKSHFIEVEDLKKRLGKQLVLRGVSLSVKRGETLVIIGGSGTGKSVLLKHLLGLMRGDSGRVVVDGQEISSLAERDLGPSRRKVGILFQDGALFDSMTVGENVAFPLRESGTRNATVLQERVAEALKVVNLEGQEDKMPINLSGGMRKRVALARAIITQPQCILYDEPTAGLDPVVSDSINRLIRRLQRELAVTSIVVTHDMKSVYHIADNVIYLREGRVYFEGDVDQLKQSEDPLVQNFIHGRSLEEDEIH